MSILTGTVSCISTTVKGDMGTSRKILYVVEIPLQMFLKCN